MSELSALSDVLTQEEIDALIQSKTESHEAALQLLKTAPTPKKYPQLEKQMEIFGRESLRRLGILTQAENISVEISSFITGQMSAYLDTLPLPTMLGFYQIEEWKQPAMISLDASLCYCLVDTTLGGRRGMSAMPLSGRTYTRIEQNILRKILASLSTDLSKAYEKNFVFESQDTNPRTALITSPACDIIITRFEIEIDKRKGVMDVILPAHLLTFIENSDETMSELSFSENLAQALSKAPLELKAVLDKKEILFKTVVEWKKGDTLPLGYFEDKPLSLMCANQELFKASLHIQKKRIQVQIEKKENGG